MKITRYIRTTRDVYGDDTLIRLRITKGIILLGFHFPLQKIVLTREELADIRLETKPFDSEKS